MKSLFVCVIVLLTLPSLAIAAVAPISGADSTADTQNQQAQITQDMQNMAKILGKGVGIKYTAKLSIILPPLAGEAGAYSRLPQLLDNTVIVEKTGKAYVELGPVSTGKQELFADGQSVTVYNEALAKYAAVAGNGNLASSMKSVLDAENILYPKHPEAFLDTEISLFFPNDYLFGNFVPDAVTAGTKSKVSLMKGVIGGKSVDIITDTYDIAQGKEEVTYSIDTATHLPLSLHKESSGGPGHLSYSFTETFSSFEILSAASPLSTYTFTPSDNVVKARVANENPGTK